MERAVLKPFVNRELAAELAEKIFDVQNATVLCEFDCYSDRAFHIKGRYSNSSQNNEKVKSKEFVIKILNSSDSKDIDFIDAENEAIQFLQRHGFPCPTIARPTGNSDKDLKSLVMLPTSDQVRVENKNNNVNELCVVRLMSFLPGIPVKELSSCSSLLCAIGQFVGSASKTLQGFTHPSILSRQSRWDLKNFPELETYLDAIVSSRKRTLARAVLDKFTTQVVPKFPRLRMGTVHSDMSGSNILGTNDGKYLHVTGLIDFGDLLHTFVISEVASSMARFMSEDDPIGSSGCLLAGYQSHFPLPGHEVELLYYFVSACLCATAVISDDQYRLFSTNENIATASWKLLDILWQIPKNQADERWANEARKFSQT